MRRKEGKEKTEQMDLKLQQDPDKTQREIQNLLPCGSTKTRAWLKLGQPLLEPFASSLAWEPSTLLDDLNMRRKEGKEKTEQMDLKLQQDPDKTQKWEKTLQLLGIVGLGQTIYRRLASYEDTEDFKQDVRLLLAPVRFGAQAFSWAAGKLEPNRIGLPTSPLSSAVQNRVLQAAAKHGSQPSDTAEEMQDSSRESMTPVSENVDLSEA
ncbi:hypothetical protein HHK36_013348 [Tetracentron sinense]|uniref:Uncharacterized protein n=1 Tax=Tetracentron sinense TaxID=13715 RepID=A0A835DFB6_TETSI|nr:hypothetical protein HHK36_013348 [Tetracentron sinense]